MKKKLKLLGNLLTIGAVLLIIRKILSMDIDFSQFGSRPLLSALGVSITVQTAVITFGCIPWLIFIQSLSGRKIPFSEAMPVYTNSNIYKYIPGNVFQYIGRNQLAADMNISHVDVACATILDIFFSVLSTGVISALLLGSKLAELLGKYGRNMLIIGGAGIALLIIAVIILKWKFSDKIKSYLMRYSKAFRPGNRRLLALGVLYYFGQNFVSSMSYFICMRLVLGSDAGIGETLTLTGAFMFAWIIGFVTPGAPGGIGIREAVMIYVSGDTFADKVMLFTLAMRIASTTADVLAFLIGKLYLAVRADNVHRVKKQT